jgi:hypothetical protein
MVYFADFFNVNASDVEKYGAFNISLINDLPLFIDPFLIFGNKNPEYQKLHGDILNYLMFLKQKSGSISKSSGQLKSWYLFPEVKQNWFGYSVFGNAGSGLGLKFARAFSSNLNFIFDDLGKEMITQSSHIEKACLFEIGIGRDNISDFTCNLIKEYLLNYTQSFAERYIDSSLLKRFKVDKVYFNYDLERWMPQEFNLPAYLDEYVILTPKEILTKDENWINSHDLKGDFNRICASLPNDQLRVEIFNYFQKQLPKLKDNEKHSSKELTKATVETVKKFPIIIQYYIKSKEENKEGARNISQIRVSEVETIFVHNVKSLITTLSQSSEFYNYSAIGTYHEAYKRVEYLKKVIENNDGYKLFYHNGVPVKREQDLQIIYRLTWFASPYDVNREPNNGRGPVDYSISMGSFDKTLVEFKLASNTKLKKNLQNQVKIYERANSTDCSIKVIMYFDQAELLKVSKVIKELNLDNDKNIILIDAGQKVSASNE